MPRHLKYLPYAFLSLGFLLLYFLTTNQNFSFDAVTNAIACESNEPIRWFHPNHLLYPLVGVLYYRFERALGYMGLSIYSLARLNSFLTAVGIGLWILSLKRIVKVQSAILAGVFFGVTYAAWHYSVDGRAIGASILFSVLVVRKLLLLTESQNVTRGDALKLSVYSSLYIFLHGIALFHLPAVIFFLHKIIPEQDRKRKIIFMYVGSAVLILASAYSAAFYGIVRNPGNSSFMRWVLGYAAHAGVAHVGESRFWAHTALQIISGLWSGWCGAIAPAHSATEKTAVSIIAALLLGFIFRSFIRNKTAAPAVRHLIHSLMLWGALATLFLGLWSPGQEGFRLIVLVPWLSALVLADPSRFMNWFLAVGAAAVFVINLVTSIYPAAFIQNNLGFQVLKEIRTNMGEGDLILSAEKNTIPAMEVLRPYFFPEIKGGTIDGRLFAFGEKSLDPLIGRLRTVLSEGHAVYMSEDVFERAAGIRIEEKYGLRPGEMESFAALFNKTAHFGLSNGRHIYQVEFKK